MTYEIHMPEDKGVKYDSFRYPGGEVQVRIRPDQFDAIKAADTLKVTARITTGEVMELGMLTSAIYGVKGWFQSASLFLPYLPYGRADRQFVPGDGFGLKTFLDLIKQMGYTYIWSLDVHSPVASTLGVLNIDPIHIISKAIDDIQATKTGSIALLLPDKGAHRYDLQRFGLPIYQADKVRDAATGKLLGFQVPEIDEDNILIVDDICDGGGTFAGIANVIANRDDAPRQRGMYLYVTHGIFSQGIVPLYQFKGIYTTDSFPNEYGTLVWWKLINKFKIGGIF